MMDQHTNLDLNVLRTFVLGFDLGSFARAADRVGRSQSAISTQLRKLEDQVGLPLVKKSGRGLALTEAGESLLSYARRMVELNDQAVDVIRGAELEGRVRLGIPQDFAECFLTRVLERFACSHPKVRVQVEAEKVTMLVEKTLRGDLDMSLAWGRPERASYLEHVADVPIAWIGNTDRWKLGDEPEMTVPLLAFEPPCAFRDAVLPALDKAGIAWRMPFTSPSLPSLWAAAAAGLGITMRTRIGMPSSLTPIDPHAAGLPFLPTVALSLVRAQDTPTATVQSLETVLLTVVRDRLNLMGYDGHARNPPCLRSAEG